MTKSRFVVVDTQFLFEGKLWLLIQDYNWFNLHYGEIQVWANTCLSSFGMQGMVLKFDSEEDRNLFLMRWSHGDS